MVTVQHRLQAGIPHPWPGRLHPPPPSIPLLRSLLLATHTSFPPKMSCPCLLEDLAGLAERGLPPRTGTGSMMGDSGSPEKSGRGVTEQVFHPQHRGVLSVTFCLRKPHPLPEMFPCSSVWSRYRALCQSPL